MAVLSIKRPVTGRVTDDGRVFLDSFRRGAPAASCSDPACPLNKLAKSLHLAGKAVTLTLKRLTNRRSNAQNRRYWALLTCGADSLGWESTEALHEEIAHALLSLPPCPKTGLRRRMHTPELETDEFGRYMDAVMRFLLDHKADLSDWDEYEQRMVA